MSGAAAVASTRQLSAIERRILEAVRRGVAEGLEPASIYLTVADRAELGEVAEIDGLPIRPSVAAKGGSRVYFQGGRAYTIRRGSLRSASTEELACELARRGATPAALERPRNPSFGAGRTCAGTNCFELVKPGMLMCRDHWFSLPKPLRDTIWETWRARRAAEYQDAVRQAIDLVDGFGS